MFQALLADNYPLLAARPGVERSPRRYDSLFYFILAINIFFSSLIMALLICFVFKYRHREGKPHNPTGGHSTAPRTHLDHHPHACWSW